MNKRERRKIRQRLDIIENKVFDRDVSLQLNHIRAIIDIDENIHKFRVDNITRTRNLGNLNEFGRGK